MSKPSELLGPDGPVAAALGDYEVRPQQLAMADAVANAFEACEHLLVEAGTGVGKSFAYLVPALQAVSAQGRRVIVSTYTIALQEQLVTKDLPFLLAHLGDEAANVKVVLGKGRANYLCMRRLQMLCKGAAKLLRGAEQTRQLQQLADWASSTRTGARQEIDFELAGDLWRRVCCERGTCRGSRCGLYGRCFFQAARRRMLRANVLVVNHALLFSDLALRQVEATILGDYDLAVLDESHTVESVACDHFGESVSGGRVRRLLADLYDDRTDRGLLAVGRDRRAIGAVNAAALARADLFERLAEFAVGGRSGRIPYGQGASVDDSLTPALAELTRHLERLAEATGDADERVELMGAIGNLRQTGESLERLLRDEREDHAYWVTLRRMPGRRTGDVILACSPIDAGPYIREALFERISAVILTSATLTTGRAGRHGFEYIRQRVGLTDGAELQLDSPFDYRRQAKLYLETRLGDPNDLARFVPAAVEAIEYYVGLSEGRCFVLFTSYAMLRQAAEALEDFCDREGYELLVQGGQIQRTALLERFREGGRRVLLGTASFWQGVDVAGEALANVIITKLPFAVPDSPLIAARIDAIRNRGGKPFFEYQLPEAIIRFRQGFGRLIRSKTDTGFVVVLDPRITTKTYGRQFLDALPEIDVVRDVREGG